MHHLPSLTPFSPFHSPPLPPAPPPPPPPYPPPPPHRSPSVLPPSPGHSPHARRHHQTVRDFHLSQHVTLPSSTPFNDLKHRSGKSSNRLENLNEELVLERIDDLLIRHRLHRHQHDIEERQREGEKVEWQRMCEIKREILKEAKERREEEKKGHSLFVEQRQAAEAAWRKCVREEMHLRARNRELQRKKQREIRVLITALSTSQLQSNEDENVAKQMEHIQVHLAHRIERLVASASVLQERRMQHVERMALEIIKQKPHGRKPLYDVLYVASKWTATELHRIKEPARHTTLRIRRPSNQLPIVANHPTKAHNNEIAYPNDEKLIVYNDGNKEGKMVIRKQRRFKPRQAQKYPRRIAVSSSDALIETATSDKKLMTLSKSKDTLSLADERPSADTENNIVFGKDPSQYVNLGTMILLELSAKCKRQQQGNKTANTKQHIEEDMVTPFLCSWEQQGTMKIDLRESEKEERQKDCIHHTHTLPAAHTFEEWPTSPRDDIGHLPKVVNKPQHRSNFSLIIDQHLNFHRVDGSKTPNLEDDHTLTSSIDVDHSKSSIPNRQSIVSNKNRDSCNNKRMRLIPQTNISQRLSVIGHMHQPPLIRPRQSIMDVLANEKQTLCMLAPDIPAAKEISRWQKGQIIENAKLASSDGQPEDQLRFSELLKTGKLPAIPGVVPSTKKDHIINCKKLKSFIDQLVHKEYCADVEIKTLQEAAANDCQKGVSISSLAESIPESQMELAWHHLLSRMRSNNETETIVPS